MLRTCAVILFAVLLGATACACAPRPQPAPIDSGVDSTVDGGSPLDAGAMLPGDAGQLANDAGSMMTAPDAGFDAGVDAGAAFRELFNGHDLTGWLTWLGTPSSNPASTETPIGLNSDPLGVFSVATLDGEPAIRISGQVFGALISAETLGDFELELQYRWGTRTWPPLNAFDSGIMYCSVGDYGAVNAGGDGLTPGNRGGFMVSAEYQVTPGDVGSMYNLGPVSGVATQQHAQSAQGWNDVRITFANGIARHWHNGVLTATSSPLSLHLPNQPVTPLTQGRLQLQSEGGEIYMRHIRIRP